MKGIERMIMGFGVEGVWGFVLFAGNGPWCIGWWRWRWQ